ncbi:MAG: M23 family metallopeptidase [Bdellovibrionales bacterium]|nr:M23 family metallopeptidase [Bdellovibrionales bacterium]NQZ19672.1 M23 family metallopeptidase [Bdellovibrionales bacterium]
MKLFVVLFVAIHFSYSGWALIEYEDFAWPTDADVAGHVHDSEAGRGRPHTFSTMPGLTGILNPPLNACRKSGRFKQRSKYFHPGCDLSTPKNAPVKAIAPGVVVERKANCTDNYAKSNWRSGCRGDRGFGNILMLMHKKPDGTIWYSRYHHLGQVNAQIGERVEHGQEIGTVGSTGVSFGFHLHFEIMNARHVRSNPYNYYENEKIFTDDIEPRRLSNGDESVITGSEQHQHQHQDIDSFFSTDL